jgi:hypothetical protein
MRSGWEQVTDPVQRAVHFFIVWRQSLAGRMDRFATADRLVPGPCAPGARLLVS